MTRKNTWCPLHSHVLLLVDTRCGKMKWNESGFRPPWCTYRLNWARRTSWGWWDDWDDTVLQTQDSKFEPWRSEAEHATSRSRRLPTIPTFTHGWGRNIFVFHALWHALQMVIQHCRRCTSNDPALVKGYWTEHALDRCWTVVWNWGA